MGRGGVRGSERDSALALAEYRGRRTVQRHPVAMERGELVLNGRSGARALKADRMPQGPPMSGFDIDELYEAFCGALPTATRMLARDLPHALGLAPTVGIPWSQVFKHEITLNAPALLTEGMDRGMGRLPRERVE